MGTFVCDRAVNIDRELFFAKMQALVITLMVFFFFFLYFVSPRNHRRNLFICYPKCMHTLNCLTWFGPQ